jgi:hypothetical protein
MRFKVFQINPDRDTENRIFRPHSGNPDMSIYDEVADLVFGGSEDCTAKLEDIFVALNITPPKGGRSLSVSDVIEVIEPSLNVPVGRYFVDLVGWKTLTAPSVPPQFWTGYETIRGVTMPGDKLIGQEVEFWWEDGQQYDLDDTCYDQILESLGNGADSGELSLLGCNNADETSSQTCTTAGWWKICDESEEVICVIL